MDGIPDTAVVYYVGGHGGEVVKIGAAYDLPRRLDRLRKKIPAFPAVILATEPGHETLERARHVQFWDEHLAGDWFWISPRLRAHIDALAACQ